MMSGQADEFCLVEPLALARGELIESSAPAPAPDTPAPPPGPDTPTHASANNNSIGGTNNTVPSVLADDELWGPPAGARRPYQTRGGGGGTAAMTPAAASAHRVISPPWPQANDEFCGGVGDGVGRRVEGSAGGDGWRQGGAPTEGGVGGVGPERTAAAAAAVPGGRTPRRKRSSTSGINRERQFDGSSTGGSGSRLGGGRRRSGPGNGRGGLSKKTLNIVTNLKSHTPDVRTREEMEDLEEEKRLAEEERRFKENLRQKGDDFDHTIRILLLGDSGVGKTSLMTRFSEDKFAPTMISTAGVDFKVQTLDIQGKRVRCQIWDTAGQERFHVITRAYYRGAHGIALAYDVTDDDSFKNVNYWMANIQTHADRGHRMQKMILGNKVDIEERRISTKEGQDVAKEFGVPFFEVSAKNGYGVSDAFYTLAVDIVQAMEAANRRGADDRRVASKLFGGGAARLRSFASSKKPSFMSGRKIGGVSWTVGGTSGGTGVTPNGNEGGGGESGAGSESEKGTSATTPAANGTGEAVTGEGGGSGGGATAMAKSASERCKVS